MLTFAENFPFRVRIRSYLYGFLYLIDYQVISLNRDAVAVV